MAGGAADLQCGHFLVKTYAKMKELDPVRGGGHAPAAPPWIRQCSGITECIPFIPSPRDLHSVLLK